MQRLRHSLSNQNRKISSLDLASTISLLSFCFYHREPSPIIILPPRPSPASSLLLSLSHTDKRTHISHTDSHSHALTHTLTLICPPNDTSLGLPSTNSLLLPTAHAFPLLINCCRSTRSRDHLLDEGREKCIHCVPYNLNGIPFILCREKTIAVMQSRADVCASCETDRQTDVGDRKRKREKKERNTCCALLLVCLSLCKDLQSASTSQSIKRNPRSRLPLSGCC